MAEEKEQLALQLSEPPPRPVRTRLPDERVALTHKFTFVGGDVRYSEEKVGGEILHRKEVVDLNGYITVGVYPDGTPGELFIKMGKPGGVWAVYDALAIAISVGLQYGIPVEVFASKFKHMKFEPRGMTKSEEIPIAKSIMDYLARWMEIRFPAREEETDGDSGCSEGSAGESTPEGGTETVSVPERGEATEGEATAEAGGDVQGE